jgi:heme/copper-type cytochrome/quinol oxidase subunit 4
MQGEPVKYILIEPITGKPGADQFVLISPDGLSNYLNSTYSFVLILIAITAVFYLIYGGMVYLTTDIANKQKQGKEIIVRVITGLVFVFSVWVILNSINPNILKNNLTLGVINTVTGTPTDTPDDTDPAAIPNTSTETCREIPSSELVSVQGRQLKKDAASQFNLMYTEAQKAGITLNLTSAYRSPSAQTALWNQYGCKIVSGRASCTNNKSVAIPCSLGGNGSNHSTGYAVDISIPGCSNGNSNCSHPIQTWLKTNGGKYGFNNALPNDPIHWSPSGR